MENSTEIIEGEGQNTIFRKVATELIGYLKEQRSLLSDQKKYGKTIKYASIVTAIATLIMAIAMIVQCWIMFSGTKQPTQSEISNTRTSQQPTQSSQAQKP